MERIGSYKERSNPPVALTGLPSFRSNSTIISLVLAPTIHRLSKCQNCRARFVCATARPRMAWQPANSCSSRVDTGTFPARGVSVAPRGGFGIDCFGTSRCELQAAGMAGMRPRCGYFARCEKSRCVLSRAVSDDASNVARRLI